MFEESRSREQQLEQANAAKLPDPDKVRLPGTEGPAQHFVNYVKQQLIDEYGQTKVFGGGLRVRTTIDLELQQTARDAISKWLTQPDGPSAALVAIDPRDGAVRAMVGGNNYRKSQFNLAVQGVRQPGSSFKPFVLATALREGISPATHFESAPQSIDLGDKDWVVGNYDDIYYGNIDLEKATIESDNSVYAQLTQLVGSKKVAETAKRMGIRSKLDGYFAIGLGAEAVTPLELARAYATLAHGGRRADGKIFGNKPRVITEVTEDGRKQHNTPKAFNALTATQAGVVNSILQKAVRYGTGKRAYIPDRPMAGKTGTTENYGDAWFVGYTPQLAVAVWVGYPTTLKPMLTEFHGDRRHRRQLPGPDLEVVHGEGAQGRAARGLPGAGRPVRGAEARRPPRRPADARQRALPLAAGGRLLRRDRPDQDGELPRERGPGARRAQADARRGGGAGRGAAADGRRWSTSPPRRCSGPGSSSTRSRGAATGRRTTGSS